MIGSPLSTSSRRVMYLYRVGCAMVRVHLVAAAVKFYNENGMGGLQLVLACPLMPFEPPRVSFRILRPFPLALARLYARDKTPNAQTPFPHSPFPPFPQHPRVPPSHSRGPAGPNSTTHRSEIQSVVSTLERNRPPSNAPFLHTKNGPFLQRLGMPRQYSSQVLVH